MDDYISRQAAIDALYHVDEYNVRSVAAVKALPSTQLEIIHCCDCKFYDGRPCGIVDWYNTVNDFCSRAERRKDG